MDELVFMNSKKPVTSKDILEIEKTYSVSLFEDYKELILRFNGGRPNKALFEGVGESLVLSELMPIKYGKYTLEDAIIKFKIKEQILPDYLVPFALDPADNLICLSQRNDNIGSV